MAKTEALKISSRLTISLVYSHAPRQVREWALELAGGATVAHALAECGIFDEYPELSKNRVMVGIWGAKCRLDHPLIDRDRIEIYRTLRVDPMVARRERFNRQGAKSAGLFAKTRSGAKAGY